MRRLVVACLVSGCLIAPAAQAKPRPKLASSATVVIEAFQYSPDHVTIRRGGTVTFVNKDGVPHTATPDPGAHFKGTGLIEGGAKATVRFDQKGRQAYHCDFHPSMTGVVTVQ
jgi:plastocyanin